MFDYINGKVASIRAGTVVIDVNGIGFALNSTQSALNEAEIGLDYKMFTFLKMREDGADLYGFSSKEERVTFEMLLSVSGVGAKVGIAILSALSPSELALAVATGDDKAITKANGVGGKLAQRIVLELKDKVAKDATSHGAAGGNIGNSAPAQEAISALMVLGYSAEIARKAVDSAINGADGADLTTEKVIMNALKGGLL